MSSMEVNDENHGVCLGGKQSSSSNDIFDLEQPTGRPSILRQTENLPNKTVPKGVKVCFQTPRRDPATKRILSPTKSAKMTNVDECTKAMESLNLDKTNTLPQDFTEQSDGPELGTTHPDDDMPIQNKGGYQLDFDNLDAVNPFQGSDKMALSPARPAAEDPLKVQNESHGGNVENMLEESNKTDAALDETLPFTPSVENSLADASIDISSTDSSVVTVIKTPAVEEQDSSPSRIDEEQPVNTCSENASASFGEDAPLPPKGSYNLDFDNLDSVNPFQTGGSKILNSPVPGKNMQDKTLPVGASEIKEINPAHIVDVPVQSQVKPIATVAPISTTAAKLEDAESMPQPAVAVAPVKEGPVKLEFNFDDGNEVKQKPPPKKFGKRPTGPKSKEGKPASDSKPLKPASDSKPLKPASDSKPLKEAPVKSVDRDVDDIPVPKGSYTFDFEKFDDPAFNPFGTNLKMNNSPKSSRKSSSAANAPSAVTETSLPEQKDKPVEKETVSPTCAGEQVPVAAPNPAAIREDKNTKAACSSDKEFQQETQQNVQNLPEPSDQKTQSSTPELSEMFLPATVFMSSDFDGQIDYLEQFGSSSFKESALRKQSLYLKFDPLLRESPKKCAGPAAQAHVPHPAAFVSSLETPQMTEKEAATEPHKNASPLFDITTPNPLMLESLVPPFPQPASTEDAIIEVLKYSQKDMDAAMAKAQEETKEKEEQWSAKYNKLSEDGEAMRKVISELKLQLAKLMDDQEKKKEVAQMKINKVILEKEQLSTELNSMETSFSELFKRLEKYKNNIEDYKKNEETLKTCAQDYLGQLKLENQRYQALKAHAEEKLNHANKEIAEVRSKFKAESAALQAQLRREQLKVQSLQKSLDQKAKDAEELTKLCDELIANAQKV